MRPVASCKLVFVSLIQNIRSIRMHIRLICFDMLRDNLLENNNFTMPMVMRNCHDHQRALMHLNDLGGVRLAFGLLWLIVRPPSP